MEQNTIYTPPENLPNVPESTNELFITTTISAYSVLRSLKKMAITITPAFSSHSWK